MMSGFTLVELLVVVTIIVVLLALLVPAMDKAIYQAELAVCAANQHGIGTGAMTYAMSYKRYYPIHVALQTGDALESRRNWEVTSLYHPLVNFADDRQVIKGYIDLKLLLDPMVQKIDLENVDRMSITFVTYGLWYGWRYEGEQGGMNKVGDRLSYRNDRFRVLTADFDKISETENQVLSSHPDYDGTLTSLRFQDETNGVFQTTASIWFRGGTFQRSPIDRNIQFDDLSVQRYDRVVHEDKRMVTLSPKYQPDVTAVGKEQLPAE